MTARGALQLIAGTLAATLAGSAIAAVSAEEAKRLGNELTLFGAEKAGNKAGTIPEYKGEGVKAPASYDPKKPGQKPDPWNDKPLYTITAQNAAQYGDQLTEAQKMLFKRFPAFRMDVYPTRRSATFPKYALDRTVKNATSCKAVDNEQRLEGCYGGLPFPIPKTGNEAMWNHIANVEAPAWQGLSSNWLVPANGKPVLQAYSLAVQEAPLSAPDYNSVNKPTDYFWKVRTNDSAPARRAGEKILILDALDQNTIGRRAYQYVPGQRRVKLAPDLSFDTPNPYTGGISTMDEAKLFAGSLVRFNWKLAGKAEKFIAYNNFAINDNKTCPDEKLIATANFPNPDCIRWELHRTWVVNATLDPKFRHIYKKRTYYWDEDGFQAGSNENYDAAGSLYRMSVGTYTPFFNGIGSTVSGTYYIDLLAGIWAINGSGTCAFPECGWSIVPKPESTYFSPEAMAGEGIR